MASLIGFVFAILVVLAGPGSTFLTGGSGQHLVNGPNGGALQRAAAATVRQVGDAPDPNHRVDSSASLTDNDDDCDEDACGPASSGTIVSPSTSAFDPLLPCAIRPAQGHRTGPEKPPRV